MGKLVAKIYHNKFFGQGDPVAKSASPHPLSEPSLSAMRQAILKAGFVAHPCGQFAKNFDGYTHTASVYTSKDGKSRCGSSSYRIPCHNKENN